MHLNRDICRVQKSVPKPEKRTSGPHRTADIGHVESQHPWELLPRVDYQEESLTGQHNGEHFPQDRCHAGRKKYQIEQPI